MILTTELEVESFLSEYSRSRIIIEATVRASLNRALEFEEKFQKPFYNFTVDEILEMYKSMHAISDRSRTVSTSEWLLFSRCLV